MHVFWKSIVKQIKSNKWYKIIAVCYKKSTIKKNALSTLIKILEERRMRPREGIYPRCSLVPSLGGMHYIAVRKLARSKGINIKKKN